MKTNKTAIVISNIISFVQMGVGIVDIGLFGLAFIGNLLDAGTKLSATDILLFFLFIGLGVIIFNLGRKRNQMSRMIKNYENVIGELPSIKIEELSKKVLQSEHEIEKNVEWMIRKNFFTDAFINHDEKALTFREAYEQKLRLEVQESIEKEQARIAKENVEYVSVVCECCEGTTEIVKGTRGTCSYCGAAIVSE